MVDLVGDQMQCFPCSLIKQASNALMVVAFRHLVNEICCMPDGNLRVKGGQLCY